MGWSRFWLNQASRAAARRRRRYEIEPPLAIRKTIEPKAPHVGFLDSIRLILYVVFGTLRGFFILAWRFLTDLDTPGRKREISALASDLGGRLSEASALASGLFERRLFSRDLARVPRLMETLLFRTTPLLAVHAASEEDVISTLRFASERKITVYPRGVSSSAFGGAVPTRNGIALDLSPLSQIMEIDPGNLTTRVQPGVRWADLGSALEALGLSTASTPSSRFSTVAGWVATGGLGIESFKYGHIRESVVSARVILPSGEALELGPQNEHFRYLFGTEGQFGIITELVLRVRPRASYSSAHLFYFNDAPPAFDFIDRLVRERHRPSHVVFYDRARLAEENQLLLNRLGSGEPIFEEREAVLVHFDDERSEQDFLRAVESEGFGDTIRIQENSVMSPNFGRSMTKTAALRSDRAAASYIWSERYFALKAQRLGPSLLAGEVLLGRAALPKFIRRARRLARRFGADLGIEAILAGADECTVIAAFPCDFRKPLSYFLNLVLVQLLVRLGTRLGGSPYGIGTWNSPFLRKRYPAETVQDMRRLKKEIDPRGVLNPGKFFRLRARFFNIPGPIFHPWIYAASLDALNVLSPFVGLAARFVRPEREPRWTPPPPEAEKGTPLLSQASLRCTFCGACVSVCPAYVLTHDELATGRAKLRLAEAVLSQKEIPEAEAARVFQCLRCNLCEEVCQTRLPLVDCYGALEAQLEGRFGRPAETIARFVGAVDENRDWIERTFGLSLADWSPGGPAARTPKTPQPAAGGKP
jgi:FAD/FMN-containing dehydrogenase/ferredoxin